MAKAKIELKDLLEAGAHFGHQASRWHPKMKPYLYAVRDGVHIFDLVLTKKNLLEAMEFLKKIASEGGVIVFVGTKRQVSAIMKEEAVRVGMPYVSQRWLGGTITNWDQISKRIKKLMQMKEDRKKGVYKKYTKKEQILLDREIARLEKFFGGLVDLKDLPTVLFVVDIKREITAVKEAVGKKIPVVAVVDSNCDPEMVDYVIPANDDAAGSVKYIVSKAADAIEEGLQAWAKKKPKKTEDKDKASK